MIHLSWTKCWSSKSINLSMEESMDKYMDFYWILYTRWNDGLLRYVGCNKSLMFSLLKLKNNATILKPLHYLFSNLYLKLLCIYITFSMYPSTKPLFCTFWNPTSLSNLIHFHIPIVISVFSGKKNRMFKNICLSSYPLRSIQLVSNNK